MYEKRRIMIYSPKLGGHGQIYCANFIHHFLKKGCKVFLVTEGFHGRSWKETTNNPYLQECFYNQNVQVLNITSLYNRKKLSNQLKVVVNLQIKYHIDYTLFAFADTLWIELAGLIFPWSRKLKGQNFGIFFLLSNFIYKEINYISEKNLFSQGYKYLRKQNYYIKSKLSKIQKILFLEIILKHFRIFDGSFFLDEYFVTKMNHKTFFYMPDPFKPFKKIRVQSDKTDFITIQKDFSDFLKLHRNKDIIFCFGNEIERHGVDFLLHLVNQHDDLAYVHLGETTGKIKNKKEYNILKNKLFQQQRLFEIDHYVADYRIIELFFESIKYLLLPYKHHYGSSGMMLEALSYNKPVLVPNNGLMSARVSDHQLGRIYNHLSYSSFCKQFHILRAEYHIYHKKIQKYYESNFSQDKIIKALEKIGI